jgi:hypothetical protein
MADPKVPDTIGDKAAKLKVQQDAPPQPWFTKEHVRLVKAAQQQERRKLS